MTTCGGSFLVQEQLSLADIATWATLYALLAPENTASNGERVCVCGGGGRREKKSIMFVPFVYVLHTSMCNGCKVVYAYVYNVCVCVCEPYRLRNVIFLSCITFNRHTSSWCALTTPDSNF